ncbi:MAG: sugar phosphate isomerase/epimerase [Anaerolineae bacterium]|jgi:sugar phosphate isomerase/epimerase|nr:sugar phosphate isomerase/epimerase [Anaerolineae bacterium]
MDFSCHSWGFNDLTLPEALGTMARMGFRYVDLGTGAHLNPARATAPATRAAALAELRDDLALFNLKPADIYLMLPHITDADETRRTRELKVFLALLPFVKATGAAGITVSPGLMQSDDPAAAFERSAALLRDMLAGAQHIGLPLSIEPHLDSVAPTPAAALRLLAAVPGLQITLDIAQMVCQKVKPAEMWGLLPHTRHVHLRQAKAKKLQTPFDKGTIDLAEVMQALEQAAYGGFVCIEYLQTLNWHGTMQVNSVTECLRLRDALKALRPAP